MTDVILPPDDEEDPGRHEPGTFVRGSTEKIDDNKNHIKQPAELIISVLTSINTIKSILLLCTTTKYVRF